MGKKTKKKGTNSKKKNHVAWGKLQQFPHAFQSIVNVGMKSEFVVIYLFIVMNHAGGI